MKLISLLAALVVLSSCGADGPPEPPGMAISGDVRFGVTNR